MWLEQYQGSLCGISLTDTAVSRGLAVKIPPGLDGGPAPIEGNDDERFLINLGILWPIRCYSDTGADKQRCVLTMLSPTAELLYEESFDDTY